MDVSAIALQGLDQANAQIEQAATRVASAGALSPDGATIDTVNLATEIVALTSAQDLASVNLATLKVADQIQKTAVDLLA